MTSTTLRALTIAGSDSSGGAGIQADLKTFAAHGVFGLSAITAITAQNTLGVTAVEAVSAELVTAQIEAVMSDIGADAAKTGMLPNAAVVEAVAAAVLDLEIPLLVVDPVMIATSGDSLTDDEAVAAMKSELLGRAFVVTPNIPEAEVLSGIEIRDADSQQEAARRIVELGAARVIVKGGHLDTDPIVDLLYDGNRFVALSIVRVAARSTHGTGCTFAAAIAARLAHGDGLEEAARRAQQYVAAALKAAPGLGHGQGPMNHFPYT